MSAKFCTECGAPLEPGATECRSCGHKIAAPQGGYTDAQQVDNNINPQQDGYYSNPQQDGYYSNPQQDGYYNNPQQDGYYNSNPQQDGYYNSNPQQDGYYNNPQQDGYYSNPQQDGYYTNPQQGYYPQQNYVPGVDPMWPVKSKLAAGLLGIFLGGLGIHKFYLGKIGQGILYLLFSWTMIPGLIGFVEGIVYLCTSDENFMLKHHVRLY